MDRLREMKIRCDQELEEGDYVTLERKDIGRCYREILQTFSDIKCIRLVKKCRQCQDQQEKEKS